MRLSVHSFLPLSVAFASPFCSAAPFPAPDLLSRLSQNWLNSLLSSQNPSSAALLAAFGAARSSSQPSSTNDALDALSSTNQDSAAKNPAAYAASLLFSGLAAPPDLSLLASAPGPASTNNVNSIDPSSSLFPSASNTDAPYTLTEAQLRAALYIPSAYAYGAIPPILLVPGTGTTGYEAYAPNLLPIITSSNLADPCFLNIPSFVEDDAQTNAEYVAYAINYLSSISGKKQITVMTWSQGSLLTQWALKYYPSTRPHVRSFIALSPNFHGTLGSIAACASPPGSLLAQTCTVAVRQQSSTSAFVRTLPSNGGDRALVPTTTVYSTADWVVTPQTNPFASGALTQGGEEIVNVQIQDYCKEFAGSYGHEGVLFHPLTRALVLDVLKNGGAADLRRVDVPDACRGEVKLEDVKGTEGMAVLCSLRTLS